MSSSLNALGEMHPLERWMAFKAITPFFWTMTLVGVAFQAYVSIKVDAIIASQFPQIMAGSVNLAPIVNDTSFLLTIILFPVFYCSILPLLFIPKRIISPLDIQIGTLAINSILIVQKVISSGTTNFGGSGVVLWITAAYAYVLIGLVQTVFVRWFIGMNVGNLFPQTYSVSTSFSQVKKAMLQQSFMKVWRFEKQPQASNEMNRLILVSREEEMVVVARANAKNQTALAVVSYDVGFYTVEADEKESEVSQSMLNDLKCRLPRDVAIKHEKKPSSDMVYEASMLAERYASRLGRSQLSTGRDIWRRLPSYLRYAIPVTLVTYGLLSGVFFAQKSLGIDIELSAFYDLSGVFFIGFVAELGLAGWQEIQRSRETKDR